MKIAVYLTGHMRKYKESGCADSLLNVFLKGLDYDIFIHTWTKLTHKTITWDKMNKKDWFTKNKDYYNKTIDLDDIMKTYKPKMISVDQQIIHNKEILGFMPNPLNQVFSITAFQFMTKSIKKTDEMREEYENKKNIKYDRIIRVTPCLKFTQKFNKDELIDSKDYLYHTHHIRLPNNNVSELLFGNPKFFEKYRSFHKQSLKKNFDKFENGNTIWPPEHVWLKYAKDNNIPLKKSIHTIKGDIWKIKGYK